MKITTPIYVLWVATWLVQWCIMLRLLWVRGELKFPLFFGYIFFQVAHFPFAFLLFNRSISLRNNIYFSFYSQEEAISVILGLACAYEVFSTVLNDYESVRPFKTSLFRWGGVILAIVGALVALKLPGGDASPMQELVTQLERASRIVQSGLLLFLLVFASYLGMEWKKTVFGIALGFGSYAAVKLVLLTLVLQVGASVTGALNLVNGISYFATSMIWLRFIWAREAVVIPLRSAAPPELAQWNQTLKGMF